MNKNNIDYLYHPDIVNNIISFIGTKTFNDHKTIVKFFYCSKNLSLNYLDLLPFQKTSYSIHDITYVNFLETLFDRSITDPKNSNAKRIFNKLFSKINLGSDNIKPIETACKYSNNEALKLLLKSKTAKIYGNEIIWACRNNNIAGVKLLIEDGRTDLSIENNIPLRIACYNKNIDLMMLFFNDPSVDLSVYSYYPIQVLFELGKIDIAYLLCSELNLNSNELIQILCDQKNIDVAKKILFKENEKMDYFSEWFEYNDYHYSMIFCVANICNNVELMDHIKKTYFVKDFYYELIFSFFNDMVSHSIHNKNIEALKILFSLEKIEPNDFFHAISETDEIKNKEIKKIIVEEIKVRYKKYILSESMKCFNTQEEIQIYEILLSQNLLKDKFYEQTIYFETKDINLIKYTMKYLQIKSFDVFYYILEIMKDIEHCDPKLYYCYISSTTTKAIKCFSSSQVKKKKVLSLLEKFKDKNAAKIIKQKFDL